MITGPRLFWLLISAMWALAALCFIVAMSEADARPITVKVDGNLRGYRYTGTLTLREPVTDRLLGTYRFVSGGLGRGSAPFGRYSIGRYRDDSWIGPRWELHAAGVDPVDGASVWDPRVNDMRTWIQLHSMHGMNAGTFGCFGVFGGPAVWREFVAHMKSILAVFDHVSFVIDPAEEHLIAVAVGE